MYVLQEDHTTKQMLEHFTDLAGNKAYVERRSLVGPQLEAFGAAVRQDDVHVLAVAVSISYTSLLLHLHLCLKVCPNPCDLTKELCC